MFPDAKCLTGKQALARTGLLRGRCGHPTRQRLEEAAAAGSACLFFAFCRAGELLPH